MSCRRISWSGLPPELLTLVAKRLGTRTDAHNFKLVCNTWRVAASYCTHGPKNQLSPIFPYKFSIPPVLNDLSSNKIQPLTLVVSSIFLVRSLVDTKRTPWLLFVEELNPGKLSLRHYRRTFTRITGRKFVTRGFHSSLPQSFNPTNFAVSQIHRFYTLLPSAGLARSPHKLVLIVDPNCRTLPNIGDCEAIELSSSGRLYLISPKFGTRQKISSSEINVFDDVVTFEGSVYAIDRKGRAYIIEHKQGTLRNVVSLPVGEGCGRDGKKLLAAETCTGELFLVHRCPANLETAFKIYKLNDERNKWNEVEGIGDDRILFVTFDKRFFAKAKDFPGFKGNCMMFHSGQFPSYDCSSVDADSEIIRIRCSTYMPKMETAVHHFDAGPLKPAVGSEYSALVWPPPSWLKSDAELFNRISVTEILVVRDLYSRRLASKPTSEVETSVAEAVLPIKDDQDSTIEDASRNHIPNIKGPTIIDIDTFPAVQVTEVSQGTFKSFNVCPEFVPILQEIWDKYGDLMQGHVVKSTGLLMWALESLAKMVIILQGSSGLCLNESQATYLSATFTDLRLLKIKLDWLVPFVETALTLHKTVSNTTSGNAGAQTVN